MYCGRMQDRQRTTDSGIEIRPFYESVDLVKVVPRRRLDLVGQRLYEV